MSKIIDILNVFKNQIPEEYKSYADDVIDSYKREKYVIIAQENLCPNFLFQRSAQMLLNKLIY